MRQTREVFSEVVLGDGDELLDEANGLADPHGDVVSVELDEVQRTVELASSRVDRWDSLYALNRSRVEHVRRKFIRMLGEAHPCKSSPYRNCALIPNVALDLRRKVLDRVPQFREVPHPAQKFLEEDVSFLNTWHSIEQPAKAVNRVDDGPHMSDCANNRLGVRPTTAVAVIRDLVQVFNQLDVGKCDRLHTEPNAHKEGGLGGIERVRKPIEGRVACEHRNIIALPLNELAQFRVRGRFSWSGAVLRAAE